MQDSHIDTQTVRAAHNLSIELGPGSWRLVNGARLPDQPDTGLALLQAAPESILCSPAFARARQIPAQQLRPLDVARVVVGWAPESRNWHLGLLLTPRAETNYQVRWCALATWPSGAAQEYESLARLAGQSLAQVINRPLQVVAPPAERPNSLAETQAMQRTAAMPALAVTPAALSPAVEIAVRQPPFDFEEISLAAIPRGFVWHRRSGWLVSSGLRAVGLLLLAAMFIVLGVGSQNAGLAPVTPPWLPWLGIAVGLLTAGVALHSFWKLLAVTDVVVDTSRGEVRSLSRFSGQVRWKVPFGAVQYLLLSQTPAHMQGRNKADGSVRVGLDAWMHLFDGEQFRLLAEIGHIEGKSHQWPLVRSHQKQPARRVLALADYDTPAHHAALALAQAIGTEAWVDVRPAH